MAALESRKGFTMSLNCCGEDPCETLVIALPGPPGRPGLPGSGAEFYHTQAVASSSWTVNHNLNKQIVGALVYSGDLGTQYDGVFVEQLSPNSCRLWVSPPLAGIARIF